MSNNLMQNMLTEHIMEKVVRDKIIMQQKEQQQQDQAKAARQKQQEEDFDPDFDDDELKGIMLRMKEQRLQELENKQQKQEKIFGQGEYREIVEEEFLPSVTKNHFTVVHFYHNEFQRCKIVDKHLRLIAQRHPECKFFYLNAEKSPFFITKLAIQMLPTICIFVDGILKDRIVGFIDFGGRDDFKTIQMTRRLVQAKIIKPRNKAERGFQLNAQNSGSEDEDDEASDLEQE